MVGQGSDFSVRPATPETGVHRVEREAETHDLGRRDAQGRTGSGKHKPQDEEAQEVAVEVSAEYIARHEAHAEGNAGTGDSSAAGAVRKLDIEA